MVAAGHVLLSEDPVVLKAAGVYAVQKPQDSGIGLRAIGHKEVGVLGGTHIAVENDAEATDDDVLEADGVGIGDDAGEVRTRELVLGHGRP
jgi:hypothetical protein